MVAQAAQADAKIQQQHMPCRRQPERLLRQQHRDPDSQCHRRQYRQRPSKCTAQITARLAVEAALQGLRQAAETDQRMPAPHFAEQPVQRHAGHHQQGQHTQIESVHACPFNCSGKPAATHCTRSQMLATAWLRRPASSTNQREIAPCGTIPMPTSLDTSTTSPLASDKACKKRARSMVKRAGASMRPISGYSLRSENSRLDSHTVRQSTSTTLPAVLQRAMASPSASCSSTVCQWAYKVLRCCRCKAMRAAISSSPTAAVAI